MYKYLILLAGFALFGCGTSDEELVSEKEVEKAAIDSEFAEKKLITMQKNGITLTEFTDFPVFKDAVLSLVSPKGKARVGKNDFEFDVKNFPLAVSTVDQESTKLKTQNEGQHIKFIYSGHLPKIINSPMLEENLSAGENYIFAVLSRSYNLSVHAAKQGYVMSKISIYENKSKIENATGSHLIPISPVGQYEYEFSKKILLDFYLVNTQIKENGNYVLVTIDNTEFIIKKWVPFTIEGLNAGMHSVSFKLMDVNNHLIPGPFNDVGKIEFTLLKGNDIYEIN
jgi:hypothetical protein